MEATGQLLNTATTSKITKLHEVVEVKQLGHKAPSTPDRPIPLPSFQRQRQKHLTDDQVAQLLSDYKRGVAVNELAGAYGVHRTTVMAHVERAGIRRRWRTLTEADIDEASHLYESGLSLKVIAEQFAVNPTTVWKALIKAGVEIRPQSGRRKSGASPA